MICLFIQYPFILSITETFGLLRTAHVSEAVVREFFSSSPNSKQLCHLAIMLDVDEIYLSPGRSVCLDCKTLHKKYQCLPDPQCSSDPPTLGRKKQHPCSADIAIQTVLLWFVLDAFLEQHPGRQHIAPRP